jgi:hypothetical protein
MRDINAHEKENFKFKKWFMILKNGNHFLKIEEVFPVMYKNKTKKFFGHIENVFGLFIIFSRTKH